MDNQTTDILTSYLPMIALVLAVLSLVLIGVLFNKVGSVLNSIKKIDQTPRLNPELVGSRFESNLDNSRIVALEKKIADLAEKIQEFEKPAKHLPEVKEPEREPQPVVIEPVVLQEQDITYYSKFPDLDHGFAENDLVDKQNGEQIYELILTPDQGRGVFYISESIAVQKYALTDVNYYLPRGCNFLNQPGISTRIKTVEAGTLVKSGDTWVIEDKAQIEFI